MESISPGSGSNSQNSQSTPSSNVSQPIPQYPDSARNNSGISNYPSQPIQTNLSPQQQPPIPQQIQPGTTQQIQQQPIPQQIQPGTSQPILIQQPFRPIQHIQPGFPAPIIYYTSPANPPPVFINAPIYQPRPMVVGGSSKPDSPSQPELKMNINRMIIDYKTLQIIRFIGKGSFGTVYLAKWNQQEVAVKTFNFLTFQNSPDLVTSFENEVSLLA